MIYTVRYIHIEKSAFVEALFVEAPGQLPSLKSAYDDDIRVLFFVDL